MLYTVPILLLLICLLSCTTTGKTPPWIHHTPDGDDSIQYVVGGPAQSPAEARLMIGQELAERMYQTVTAQTALRSSASIDDLSDFVHEQLQTWVEITADAVIAGVETRQRYQDPRSHEWWILASISNQQLIDSYQNTIDSRMKKEAEKEQHLATLKAMILPYYLRREPNPPSTVMDDFKLLASAFDYLNEHVISSPKNIEIDGRTVELDTYLKRELATVLDGITIEVVAYKHPLPLGADLAFTVRVENNTDQELGPVPVIITIDTTQLDGDCTIQQGLAHLLVSRKYVPRPGTHTVKIQLDGRAFGTDKYAWWNRFLLPQAEFPLEVVEPKIQWVCVSESSSGYPHTDYLSSKALTLLSSYLKEDFSDEASPLGTLVITVKSHEGTPNPYGIIFLHGHLEIALQDGNGDRLYTHVLSPITVSGTDMNRTSLQLADQLVAQLQGEKTLMKDLRQRVETMKNRPKEPSHEKSSL